MIDKELVNTLVIPREAVSSLLALENINDKNRWPGFNISEITQKFNFLSLAKWGTAVVTLSIIFAAFAFQIPITTLQQPAPSRYSIFSSTPLTIDNIDTKITHIDSKAERIDSVFRKYKCPLAGFGQVFVDEAEKNEIPYWLLPAISFQESGCGKLTPKIGGIETFNLFGWAVWGNNTHSFDSYEHAIQTVSKYMYTKFYSKNITELCEIMKVYTPPSAGSWCRGVGYFAEEIESYITPMEFE